MLLAWDERAGCRGTHGRDDWAGSDSAHSLVLETRGYLSQNASLGLADSCKPRPGLLGT